MKGRGAPSCVSRECRLPSPAHRAAWRRPASLALRPCAASRPARTEQRRSIGGDAPMKASGRTAAPHPATSGNPLAAHRASACILGQIMRIPRTFGAPRPPQNEPPLRSSAPAQGRSARNEAVSECGRQQLPFLHWCHSTPIHYFSQQEKEGRVARHEAQSRTSLATAPSRPSAPTCKK